MILGKNLYDQLPVWAQTIAVNAASARGFRAKYGRAFHRFSAALAANERKSRDELLHDQQQSLRQLLRYAREHVPYYRQLDCSPDRLEDWPLLDKQTVVAQPARFLSDEFAPRQLMTLHTSGTTGTPLAVRFTAEFNQLEQAFRWRHRAWAGIDYPSRSAYVSGHPVVPPTQTRPPFWRFDRIEDRLLCSSYHLTFQNWIYYIAAFHDYEPAFIHGYPSSLYLLARAILYRGLPSPRPRAVFSASETLLDFQRTAIERAFGAKVFNWYGNTEFTCNITECAAGNLHYRTDYGLLELAANGAMVATGLHNRAMPLIRYHTGDCATAKTGNCPCGCAFPLIERIEGRVEDYIRTPDGRFVGRMDHLFKDVQHVREAQIVQTRLEEIVLRVVRGPEFSAADEQTIRAEARQRLGDSIRVRFEFVETIERSAAGKYQFIVSQLPRDPLQSAGS